VKAAVPILIVSLVASTQAQKQPERRVERNVITSDQGTKVRIELPAEAKYLGAERWDLYGVADCELHLWVEAEADKTVKRLYWVQFEAFLSSQPDKRYNYPFTRTARLDGRDFDVRTGVAVNSTRPQRADSDGGHVWAMLEAAGYRLPPETLNVRLVYLPDPDKRTELMLIYMEDLKPSGFAAADLRRGGKAAGQLPALENAILERVTRRVKLSPVPVR